MEKKILNENNLDFFRKLSVVFGLLTTGELVLAKEYFLKLNILSYLDENEVNKDMKNFALDLFQYFDQTNQVDIEDLKSDFRVLCINFVNDSHE